MISGQPVALWLGTLWLHWHHKGDIWPGIMTVTTAATSTPFLSFRQLRARLVSRETPTKQGAVNPRLPAHNPAPLHPFNPHGQCGHETPHPAAC